MPGNDNPRLTTVITQKWPTPVLAKKNIHPSFLIPFCRRFLLQTFLRAGASSTYEYMPEEGVQPAGW